MIMCTYFLVMHYPDTMGSSNSQICIRVKEPYKQFFIAEGKELIQNYPVSNSSSSEGTIKEAARRDFSFNQRLVNMTKKCFL
jgi:hypothetical protein